MKRITKINPSRNALRALSFIAVLIAARTPHIFGSEIVRVQFTTPPETGFIEQWPLGREYSQDELSQLLNRTPPTLQVRDLRGAWRKLTLENSLDAAPAGLYFTRGQTARIGQETFLIAYRAPDENKNKRNKKTSARRIMFDTTLQLSLLNLRAIGSLQAITPFELKHAPLYILDIGTPSGDLLLRGRWHDAEADANWGAAPNGTFRWTTSTSQIQLPLPADNNKNASAEIGVDVMVLMGPRAAPQILRVDGREVARVVFGRGKRIAHFQVSAKQRSGKSFVVLSFDGLTAPAEAPDTRQLGMAVAWVAVETLSVPREIAD